MANYQNLKSRIDDGEVIVLDGAVGTELQSMGAPMDPAAWCGFANYTHPATVRQMHERYIKAGANIITTNTFNTMRPALEAAGYRDKVREINVRAVDAAIEARARVGVDREVYIAGSMSCRIPIRDRLSSAFMGGGGYGYGSTLPADELKIYVEEQADILAESGIDFFLIEHMWADNESRLIAVESAKATGLPVWVAFTATFSADEETVLMSLDEDRASISGLASTMPISNWRTIDHDKPLSEGVAEVASLGPDVIGVFHSRLNETNAALKVVLDEWSGPIIVYPDAGRTDYLNTWRDDNVANEETVNQVTREAVNWTRQGVQIIGTCCGFGVDYTKGLRHALPARIAA